jgi:hypothetical protein
VSRFVLPVRLPVASLTRVARFQVTDVFGRTIELGPTGDADDGWNLFGVTDTAEPRAVGGEQRTSPWFFLALVLPDALESQPVETVLMLRDEMANLAWAVEAFVSDDAGGILDRFGSSTMNQPAAGLAPAGIGRYRVDTVVPDHWFPLAPEPREDRESVVLRLVPLARRVGGEVTTLFPLGALLGGARSERGTGVWLHEEEVPRAGAAVVRTNEHARWHDGSVHTWTSRRKTTGGGEGSSGLRFDAVEPG